MEIGLTVGTAIDRLEATAGEFDFAEFGLAEAADVPASIDFGRLGEYFGRFDGTVAVEVFTDDVALLRDTARRAARALGDEDAAAALL